METDRKRYKIKYQDENLFNALIKSLRHYNMRAYKEFIFFYLPKLRNGEFTGEEISSGLYRQNLKVDPVFEFVYGKVYFEYSVEDNVITLIVVEPRDFLNAGRRTMLKVYKGCPVISKKEEFLIDYYYASEKNLVDKIEL